MHITIDALFISIIPRDAIPKMDKIGIVFGVGQSLRRKQEIFGIGFELDLEFSDFGTTSVDAGTVLQYRELVANSESEIHKNRMPSAAIDNSP